MHRLSYRLPEGARGVAAASRELDRTPRRPTRGQYPRAMLARGGRGLGELADVGDPLQTVAAADPTPASACPPRELDGPRAGETGRRVHRAGAGLHAEFADVSRRSCGPASAGVDGRRGRHLESAGPRPELGPRRAGAGAQPNREDACDREPARLTSSTCCADSRGSDAAPARDKARAARTPDRPPGPTVAALGRCLAGRWRRSASRWR